MSIEHFVVCDVADRLVGGRDFKAVSCAGMNGIVEVDRDWAHLNGGFRVGGAVIDVGLYLIESDGKEFLRE